MIERPVGFVALSLPFVAVLLETLTKFPGGSWVPVAISATLCFAIAAASVELQHPVGLANVVPFALLVAVGAGAWSNPSFIGPWGPEILVGALLGVPWLLVGYVTRVQDPLGARFVFFGIAVTWGLLLLADAPVTSLSANKTSVHFLNHFFGLAAQQFNVFGGLVPGAAAPVLPLNSAFDPTYAALVAVAVGGLLLVSVRPQTGNRVPLPVAVRAFREAVGEHDVSPTYGFTPNQLEVFRDRSPGESPLLTWPPGLEPIFFGAAAAALVLVAAYFVPTWTVLGLTVAVAVAVLLLVRFTESPLPLAVAKPPRAVVPPASSGEATDRGKSAESADGSAPTSGS